MESLGILPHVMEDLDLVIVTHDHIDHCEELGPIVTFVREYDEELQKRASSTGDSKVRERRIDLAWIFHARRAWSCPEQPLGAVVLEEIRLWDGQKGLLVV